MSTSAERHSESICEQIVTAVADREGVDPLDLVPLYEAVGPEPRRSLFASASENVGRPSASHSFTYHGYEVTVDGDTVDISKQPERPDSELSSPR
ncbi:HalOD1 output domain-containing protein [Haloprofundus salilacus]|uniref:HalOD1 output domain-containing protein n=1 Tax=Haloprofundus salilacus TaxID=2876190 RepID=UPI001CCA8C03|nr:HalOD1 output domain-containing protein [Haloprofundus salilacus]